MKYYVYALCDPTIEWFDNVSPFKPFYIGKGTGNRANKHLTEAKSDKIKNEGKHCYLIDLMNKGHDPHIEYIKYFDNENDAYDYEEYLIKLYGRINIDNDGILTNISESQRSLAGGKKGMKHKKRVIRSQLWIDAVTGQKRSKETKNLWSEQRKGKTASDETKAKMSNSRSGDKNPFYGKIGENFPLSKKWKITNPNGEEFIIFSLNNWCKENNINSSTVRNSRKGWKCEEMK